MAMACALLVVAGCTSGPDYVIEVGRLQLENSMPVIDAPTSGSVNVPLSVHLATEGGGCDVTIQIAIQ